MGGREMQVGDDAAQVGVYETRVGGVFAREAGATVLEAAAAVLVKAAPGRYKEPRARKSGASSPGSRGGLPAVIPETAIPTPASKKGRIEESHTKETRVRTVFAVFKRNQDHPNPNKRFPTIKEVGALLDPERPLSEKVVRGVLDIMRADYGLPVESGSGGGWRSYSFSCSCSCSQPAREIKGSPEGTRA